MGFKSYRTFLAMGLLTMVVGEFLAHLVVIGNMIYFLMALGLYAVFTTVFFFVSKMVRPNWLYYLVGGLTGLVIIEWLMLGNFPGSGKGALHASMFAWWAAVAMVPRIFTKEDGKPLRRRVLIGVILYSIILFVAMIFVPVFRTGLFIGLSYTLYIPINFLFVPYIGKKWQLFMWLLVIGVIVNIIVAW